MHASGRDEVKVLLDECVDRRLARDLAQHSVSTVPRRGWAGIKNGELLAPAEREFAFAAREIQTPLVRLWIIQAQI